MPHLLCCGFLAEDAGQLDVHVAFPDVPHAPVLLAGGWGFGALAQGDSVRCWGRTSLALPAPEPGAFLFGVSN